MLTGDRERLVPQQMTGSINATYQQGLTDVSELPKNACD